MYTVIHRVTIMITPRIVIIRDTYFVLGILRSTNITARITPDRISPVIT